MFSNSERVVSGAGQLLFQGPSSRTDVTEKMMCTGKGRGLSRDQCLLDQDL